MKKIILIITLIFTTSLFAQYNLEFSQVRNINLATNQTATVPDGKVWKIENASQVLHLEFSADPDFGTSHTTNNTTLALSENVVWLRAGAKIKNPTNAQTSYSILEFNLVSVSSSGGGGSGDSGSGGSGAGSGSGTSGGFTGFDNTGVPGDDFTDLDGNTYGTTIINGMTWITSNYEGSTYSDGTPIPYISDWNEWLSATTGAYTYWIQDESLGYGKLYNMFALRGRHDNDENTPNKVFAPDGWHVSTFDEFDYVVGLYTVNGAIATSQYAIKSQTEWMEGTNGTNISGLDIKPYGAIAWNNENSGFTSNNNSSDPYQSIGGYTYFWYSTPYYSNPLRANSAAYITLDGVYDDNMGWGYTSFFNGIFGSNSENSNMNVGYYVRLVKDY
tara:strand:+ start:1430 stop:2593 length:1164 start_codon:yes stop_codon:yes gene_type:complete